MAVVGVRFKIVYDDETKQFSLPESRVCRESNIRFLLSKIENNLESLESFQKSIDNDEELKIWREAPDDDIEIEDIDELNDYIEELGDEDDFDGIVPLVVRVDKDKKPAMDDHDDELEKDKQLETPTGHGDVTKIDEYYDDRWVYKRVGYPSDMK